MVFLNATQPIGMIILAGTANITGSMAATLFIILLFLMAITVMFGVPLEFSVILVLPYIITVAAYYGDFMVSLIMIVTYISIILAKNFLFR